jgi:hypothetical protein
VSIIRRKVLTSALPLAAVLLIAAASSVRATSSEADFKAAYAAAEAADQRAGQLRDQWTTTAAALADAKKAAGSGDFDKAVALSGEAEALAKASILQAESERQAWKALEIH